MEEDVCLACGSPLILGHENEYRCCNPCTQIIMQELYRNKVKSEKGKGHSMPGKYVLKAPTEIMGDDIPKY